ncbi:hypothetical protein VNI00_013066 [Paramarasmius palmivorus]|uniref:Integral membrane protein n=1 Tax=Paramarasmius palmivorus TaxID=297713 RepID=A0AAW0C1E3_9AGAR
MDHSYYAPAIFPIASLLVAYFGYGLYVLLLLVRCNIRDGKKYRGYYLYTAMTAALFLFATISNIAYSIDYAQETTDWVFGDILRALMAVEILLSVLSNVLVEVVLLHRVYILWNEKVAIPHAPFLLLANLIGIVGGIMMTVGLSYAPSYTPYLRGSQMLLGWEITAAAITLWVSVLIGYKIWKASAKNQKAFPLGSLILDSGILYPVCMVIDLVLYIKYQESDEKYMAFSFRPFPTQMAGIAVAIILVRSSLGRFKEPNFKTDDRLVRDSDLATLAPPEQGIAREPLSDGQNNKY